MAQKTILIITDGIGSNKNGKFNAFEAAKKPNYKMHEIGNFCLNLFFSLSSYRIQKGYKVKIEAPKMFDEY